MKEGSRLGALFFSGLSTLRGLTNLFVYFVSLSARGRYYKPFPGPPSDMVVNRTRLFFPAAQVCILMLFLGLFRPAAAQTDYRITHYTTDNGLVQNSVTDLELDPNGFLWIATNGGLCRFDGAQFRLYNSTNSFFHTNRIDRLLLDSGRLIVRLVGGGDYYVLNERYEFKRDSLLVSNGEIFYGMRSGPVAVTRWLDQVEGDRAAELERLQSTLVNVSYGRRFVYYFRDRKIFLFDEKSGRIQACTRADTLVQTIVLDGTFIGFDPAFRMLAIRDGRQLPDLPLTASCSGLLSRIRSNRVQEPRLFRNDARTALLYYRDELWLLQFRGAELDAVLLYRGLPFSRMQPIMRYDKANDLLFVGTVADGLYLIRRNSFRTILMDEHDASRNNIYAQVQTSARFVVNQYCRYDPVSGVGFPLKQNIPTGAFFRTGDNRILYSDQNHIFIADSLMKVQDSIPFRSSTAINVAGCFLEDRQQRIWYAGYNSLGYIKDGKIEYKFHNDPYFSTHKIFVLFQYSKDMLWIGCSGGIRAYDLKHDRLSSLTYLPGSDVRSLYRARDGSIWAGTYGKGFYAWRKGKFVPLPTDAQQRLLFTHAFCEDGKGFFWIPTNNGLFQCLKSELDAYAEERGDGAVYYYHYKDCGRYTNEFNGGSNPTAVYFNNYLLLLPTVNGVVGFAPDSMRPYVPGKAILVEDVLCDGRHIPFSAQLSLPPGFTRLQLTVIAPYLGAPVNNVLEYNLQESGGKWYPVGKDGVVVFNRLPRGTYHLNVRKRTGFGTGNYAGKTIVIDVAPFWYQTNLFFLLLGLLIIGTVLFVFRWRDKTYRRRQLWLEKTVRERTADLNKTVTELHESEKSLSEVNNVQEQVISAILHDVQTPLRYLSSSAQHFNRHLEHFSTGEIRDFAGSLSQSAYQINSFTNDLLQWLIYQQHNLPDHTEPIDIQQLLREVQDLYADIAAFSGNVVQVAANEPLPVMTDKNKLKLIVRNLVDNANKHCKDGTISFSAEPDGAGARIVVADTGAGMTEEQVQMLMAHVRGNSLAFTNGRLGYVLIRDFLKIIGGTLDLQSERGKGTRVTILLPEASSPGKA